MTTKTARDAASGVEVWIPLNKLKKSPHNARQTPHGDAAIEALAASIHAKGMLQNLVVEPERDHAGKETGAYLVTAGEGRRLCAAAAGKAPADREDRADPLHRRRDERPARGQPR